MALIAQGLDLVRKGFAAQEGAIRQQIASAIMGPPTATKASKQNTNGHAKPAPARTEKAPKGSSDAVAKRVFGEHPAGLTWAELEVVNASQPEGVSFSALKKTVYRMIGNKTLKRQKNKIVLNQRMEAV